MRDAMHVRDGDSVRLVEDAGFCCRLVIDRIESLLPSATYLEPLLALPPPSDTLFAIVPA